MKNGKNFVTSKKQNAELHLPHVIRPQHISIFSKYFLPKSRECIIPPRKFPEKPKTPKNYELSEKLPI